MSQGVSSDRVIFPDDFKPASVDDKKMARVDVGSDNTITVTVPHLDGAGTPHTVFKGSQRPYNKEYVLIFDKVTGEITLEKLAANIQVKKTRYVCHDPLFCRVVCILGIARSSIITNPVSCRAEPKRNSNNNSMPLEVKRSPTYGRANGRTKVISGKKREPSLQLHPKQSPQQTSPYDKTSPPTIIITKYISSDNFLKQDMQKSESIKLIPCFSLKFVLLNLFLHYCCLLLVQILFCIFFFTLKYST